MYRLSSLFATKLDATILGITSDSRKVQQGFLFFAIKGHESDGHDFINQAIQNGAAAIVGQQDLSLEIPYIKSNNIRHDLAITAAKFYPNNLDNIAVVTGTNGKTSVADFVRQFWEIENIEAASIGTLGIIQKGETKLLAADNTSPNPIDLNQILSQLQGNIIIEGSSIGLEQRRLDGLNINIAAFTNFTQDHLDYHGSMQKYLDCKKLLFTDLLQNGTAILNCDIAEFDELKTACGKNKTITYGKNGDLKILSCNPLPHGQEIEIEIFSKKSIHKINLVGKFQAENILCALAIAHASGIDAANNISKLKSISGRMEAAANGVYVDYAHTPDALKNALEALRPHTKQNLNIVFGCGGDRDKTKRPQMGEIAHKLADKIYVTDDNPRTEDPAQIRSEILAACPGAFEIASRSKAIKQAVTELKDGDILLIAGKGHEKYQIIGKDKKYFDDVEEVKKATS